MKNAVEFTTDSGDAQDVVIRWYFREVKPPVKNHTGGFLNKGSVMDVTIYPQGGKAINIPATAFKAIITEIERIKEQEEYLQ